MSHLLDDVIQLSLFLGLAGNKKGDKIPFRFFSLSYKVLIDLDGKIFFIFSAVCNIDYIRQCRVIGNNKS